MDGIHDLGGKQGFGNVELDASSIEKRHIHGFNERWHAAVFTIMNSLFAHGAAANTDHFRHSVERIDPINYLSDGYYGRWLGGAETMLVEAGLLTQDEVNNRVLSKGHKVAEPIAARPAEQSPTFAPRSGAYHPTAQREPLANPIFAVGDNVVAHSLGGTGHTRLPSYVRGISGQIIAAHGAWVFPDANAHGHGEAPKHLYTVRYKGADLWGPNAEEGVVLNIDLFEPYLELAQ
jgi:nitrile hydratase